MKYMLLLYGREDDFDSMKPAEQRRMIAAFEAYVDAMRAEGVYDKLEELTGSAVVAVSRL